MVFAPHDFFHIPIQMLFQKISIEPLIQKSLKKLIHVMQHILQCFVQPPGIDQRRAQHIQIHPGIIPEGK